ncbi:MAG: hypothetical protein ACNYPI_09820 [Arenicellales bacterium WSBS_2016_MAG_OTU3]
MRTTTNTLVTFSTLLALGLAALSLAITNPPYAQETIEQVPVQDDGGSATSDTGSTANGIERTLALEVMEEYLKQDIFIEPGHGLKQIFIGLSLKEVLARWGKPNEVRKRGVFGRTQDWVYKDSDNTVLVVTGKSEVNELRIVGGLGSKYQTTRGVQFGMPHFQIASVYGKGKYDAKDKLLTYKNLGMEMQFTFGGLAGIKIVRAKP